MANTQSIHDGRVEVTYPVREQRQLITKAEYQLIRDHDDKVRAIKFVRDQYNLGLYESKQIVDTIRECRDIY